MQNPQKIKHVSYVETLSRSIHEISPICYLILFFVIFKIYFLFVCLSVLGLKSNITVVSSEKYVESLFQSYICYKYFLMFFLFFFFLYFFCFCFVCVCVCQHICSTSFPCANLVDGLPHVSYFL